MKYLFIIIVLLSFGCGPHVEIEYHTVSQEELWLRAGKHVDGWSTWKYEPISNDGIQKVKCDIYMMEKSWYDSWGEYFYTHILEHERRHCYEGKYHPE